MVETSARLLRLLSILQSRRDWTGAELADRLQVGLRTVRRDIDRLRELGYPVEASPGVAGGYRLGIGATLPPLLLDDEEAVAVAISLRTAATGSVTGLEDAALRALAKLQQMLPSRLRPRVSAFHATVPLGAAVPGVDADLLSAIAAACRDQRCTRIHYQGSRGASTRQVEPYRLVHTPRRWYLLAWDVDKNDWRTFRVDRIQSPLSQPGARFTPRPLPRDDTAAYVSEAISSAPYAYQAHILFHASLEEVAPHTSPTAGRLESVDAQSCVFHAGANSLHELALHVAVKGIGFQVLHPPELVPVLRQLSQLLRTAADASSRQAAGDGARSGDSPKPRKVPRAQP